jgi:hypothetical protein
MAFNWELLSISHVDTRPGAQGCISRNERISLSLFAPRQINLETPEMRQSICMASTHTHIHDRALHSL